MASTAATGNGKGQNLAFQGTVQKPEEGAACPELFSG